MKKTMNKVTKIIACLALLACTFLVCEKTGITGAYFSDHTEAKGSVPLILSYKTELNEIDDEGNKNIGIKNTGEIDVIIRVRLFGVDALPEGTVSYEYDEDLWVLEDDGYWYYKKILPAGEQTEAGLKVIVDPDKAPEEDFEITVVVETERVVYETETTLVKPDGWTYVPEGGN